MLNTWRRLNRVLFGKRHRVVLRKHDLRTGEKCDLKTSLVKSECRINFLSSIGSEGHIKFNNTCSIVLHQKIIFSILNTKI